MENENGITKFVEWLLAQPVFLPTKLVLSSRKGIVSVAAVVFLLVMGTQGVMPLEDAITNVVVVVIAFITSVAWEDAAQKLGKDGFQRLRNVNLR